MLARLVPAGEFICGLALLVGFWTPVFALIAFVMVLNYHIASGAIFELSFLANRSGLPVLGSTLGAGGRRREVAMELSRNSANFEIPVSARGDRNRSRGRPSTRRTSCGRD